MRFLWRALLLAALAASLGQSCSPDIFGGSNDSADEILDGINGGAPAQGIPEIGGSVSVQVVSQSSVDARVIIRYLVGDAESHLADLAVPSMATLEPVGPDLATIINVNVEFANGAKLPTIQMRLGQEFVEGDLKIIILTDPNDQCPDDPNKMEPGICGCGVPDTDTDHDGTPDCIDACPNDPAKVAPGLCGCGVPDTDTDGDGTPDCLDACPNDPHKIAPGDCGCGLLDVDTDGDGVFDCVDGCPADPLKIAPGACGCGVPDIDTDEDGTPDCLDGCPLDHFKTDPGICGCGVPDTDTDGDGTPDCLDNCPNDPNKTEPGECGCGHADIDSDEDGILDCFDNCPYVYNPYQEDYDDDGVGNACEIRADIDHDGDVDFTDWGILQTCFMQPWGEQCYWANVDRDLDCLVDQHDLAALNYCFSGASVPVQLVSPPACWGEEVSRPQCGQLDAASSFQGQSSQPQ